MLLGILHGETSQRAIWRRIAQFGLGPFRPLAITDMAVYQRLARSDATPLQSLFAQVTMALRERLTPLAQHDLAPFASEVVAIDETTWDQLRRHLPLLRQYQRGDDALLPGKLAGVFDVRRQLWQTALPIEQPHQNEKVAIWELLETLSPGMLVLLDRGYFSFRLFDALTERGLYWITPLRQGTSYEVGHILYQAGETLDAVVWLGKYRADQAKYRARLLQFRHGKHLVRYLTNVLDPLLLPLAEVPVLYARRWDFELAVKLVKRELGLHLWWSAKPRVLEQQLWGALVIAQIVQGIRLEIAARAGVDVFDVSLALLVQDGPKIAQAGLDIITQFVEHGRRLEYIRPSRRIAIRAPVIDPSTIAPLPAGFVRERNPRYAGKV
jgi:hypothetical protein